MYIEMQTSSSFDFKTILIEKAVIEIPIVTMSDDMVEATWQPRSLFYFNPKMSTRDNEDLFFMVIDWLQYIVLGDRIQRVLKHI
jgi:hypothetical protein